MNSHTLEEIKAISYFATSLQTKDSIEEVLWDITKNVIHKLGLVDCVIYTLDKKRTCLVQKAAYGQKNPYGNTIYNQIEIPLGKGVVGSVAKNKCAEIIPNTHHDSRYIIDDEARYSEICVPILINNELFGVLDSEHPEKNFFSEKHLHLLTIIAALGAQKISSLSQQKKNKFSKANHYFKKLESLMCVNKTFRDPNLSLSSTAALLGISACYLSSMVNAISKMSFIDYVNGYRIEEIKKNLHSKEYGSYTILSIGLEAGFNSKSTFYSAFKKHTGMSPSDYREKTPLYVRVLSNLNISDTLTLYPA